MLSFKKNISLLTGVFVLLIPLLAGAGDCPIVVYQDAAGGFWGVGEMSRELLLYLGDDHVIVPISPDMAFLCLFLMGCVVVLGLIVLKKRVVSFLHPIDNSSR